MTVGPKENRASPVLGHEVLPKQLCHCEFGSALGLDSVHAMTVVYLNKGFNCHFN